MYNRKKYRFIEVEDQTLKQKLIDETNLLFITVTESERYAFFEYFRPIPEEKGYFKVFDDIHTYYFGRFGSYQAAYFQCSMGTVEADSAGYATKDAIEFLSPTIVVMPGIAFGIDEEKQNIGDVLVSEIISPYDPERIGDEKNYNRMPPIRAGLTLKNRFKESIDWYHRISNRTNSTIIVGNLLSGNKLVDNLWYRTILASRFENPIGGEMEGAGVAVICEKEKVEFIVAKGICDWADGNKHKEWQPKAAIASASLCDHVFSMRTAFHKFNIKLIDAEKIKRQKELDVVNIRRGSPLWTLNSLRTDVLSHLILDLEDNEKDGFSNECCAAVKVDLNSLISGAKEIDEIALTGTPLYDDLLKFYATYSEWNDLRGQSDEVIKFRRHKIEKLRRIRRKIALRIRSNYFPLTRNLTEAMVSPLFQSNDELATKYPDVFQNLRAAINRINKKSPNKANSADAKSRAAD